jgi:hypothetical protein
VVTQADNLLFCPYSLEEITTNFQRVFPEVGSYWALVPSFGGFSGYCWAGKRRLAPIFREIPGLKYLSPTTLELGIKPLPMQSMSK